MLDATVDLAGFSKRLGKLSAASDKALATALTWTAWDARAEVQKEMDSAFDRVTPWMRRSIYVDRATVQNPESGVKVSKWKGNGNNNPAARTLMPHVRGGERDQKAFEWKLQRAGVIRAGQSVMPGSGVRRNRYGNMTGGQVVKLLSNMNAHTEQGYTMNTRKASKRVQFLKRDKSGKPIGIWERRSRRKVVPILAIVDKAARYKKTFDYYGVIQRVRDAKFQDQYRRALKKELKKAIK